MLEVPPLVGAWDLPHPLHLVLIEPEGVKGRAGAILLVDITGESNTSCRNDSQTILPYARAYFVAGICIAVLRMYIN